MGDTLEINYSHCTAGTRKREIILYSLKDIPLGDWKLPDKQYRKFMQIPGEDLCKTMAEKSGELCELRYYDEETKEGISLARIRVVPK